MKNFKRVLSLALAALMVIGGLVVAPVDAKAADSYTKVTEIKDGGQYVIVGEKDGKYYAVGTEEFLKPGTTQSRKRLASAEVKVTDAGLEKITDEIPVWTVKKATTGDGFNFTVGNKFMYAKAANNAQVTDDTTETPLLWNWKELEGGFFEFKTTVGEFDCVLMGNPTLKETVDGVANVPVPVQFAAYKDNDSNRKNNIPRFMVFSVGSPDGDIIPPLRPEKPVFKDDQELIDAAYELKDGKYLGGYKDFTWTLTGKVDYVKSAYENDITVVMTVLGKQFECYKLKGADIAKVQWKDTITVTGPIKNFKGTIEFDGCTLDELVEDPWTPQDIEVPAGASDKEIIELAYTLEPGEKLVGEQTLTGVVTKAEVDYKNRVLVTIKVDGSEKTLYCYDLKGDGAADLKEGDEITVKGTIFNFDGTLIEAKPVELVVESTETPGTDEPGTDDPKPEDKYTELTKEIFDQVAALKDGDDLAGDYKVTGKVKEVGKFNDKFKDVKVILEVEGVGEVIAYGVKVDAQDTIKVGDEITVKGGKLMNYKGSVEFYLPEAWEFAGKVDAKGDMSTAGIVMILFAGIALVSVAAYSKKRMAR